MELSTIALTGYVLIWPAVVTVTLTIIVRAFIKEARTAKREGRTMI